MRNADRWRELHARRFPELTFDCGRDEDPGVIYSEDLRDWSDKATTPDQRRIEHYIDRYDLRDKRILHIGIGNSGFAQRFHRRVDEIVGTTIDQPEIDVAAKLALTDYKFLIHNKYAGRDDAIRGEFDFILDNNPTSPCCCIRHLATLFEFYFEKLAEGGQVVTDRGGLKWVPDDSCARWSFDFDDLAAVARAADLSAFRINRNIYVLSRSEPPRPKLNSMTRHIMRRTRALPGQIMRLEPREVILAARRLAKWVLVTTFPGRFSAKRNRKRT